MSTLARPITIRDIAQRAGLSVPTVSRVLNNKASTYRRETREHVLKVASELGYRPNFFAKAVRAGRFGAIGLLMGTRGNTSMLARGTEWAIQQQALQRDLHLVTGQLPDDRLVNDGYMPKILREWAVDGLLVSYTQECPPHLRELLDGSHVPSVWMNTKLDYDCVYPDDFASAEQATQHLIRLGHRRVAYVCHTSSTHFSVQDRLAGYEQTMTAAGLAPQVQMNPSLVDHVPDWGPVAKPESFAALLDGPDRPTAFVTYSGGEASALLYQGAIRGLRTPRDFSLVAIRPEQHAPSGVRITTSIVDDAAVGHRSVEMLIQKMSAPEQPLPPVKVTGRLLKGETSAPCGSS